MKKLRLINPLPHNHPNILSGGIFNIIPLQLVTIASLTPEDWEVDIQDESTGEIKFDDSPNLVGISIKSCSSKRGYEIGEYYRNLGIPVIFGGSHASLAPHMVAPNADSVIRGSVDNIWSQVLQDVEGSKLCSVYESTGTGALPNYRLRWELLPKGRYMVYSIISSYGCTCKCSYCSIPTMYGSKIRERPLEDVLRDIKEIDSKYFLLWDENPTADIRRSKVFFQALSILGKTWFGQATTLVVREPKLPGLLGKSGCRGLYLGIESVSQESLNSVNKSFNQSDNYAEIVKRLNDHGISAHAGIVFGFDHDDESIFDRTLEYLYKCKFSSASFKVLTPYPGTPLHDILNSQGRIIDDDMNNYDEHHIVFRPNKMSADTLQQGIRHVVREFYSFRSIGNRIARAVFEYGPINARYQLINLGWRKDYFRDHGV